MNGASHAASAAGPTDTLSRTATIFLMSIDPDSGWLVKRHRLRFRKALAAAHGESGIGAAGRARRAAIRELREAGMIERSLLPGRFPLVAGSGASHPLGLMRQALAGLGELDNALLVVLAWTGVLSRQLDRGDRKRAWSLLRHMQGADLQALRDIDPNAAPAASMIYLAQTESADPFGGLSIDGTGGGHGLGGGHHHHHHGG